MVTLQDFINKLKVGATLSTAFIMKGTIVTVILISFNLDVHTLRFDVDLWTVPQETEYCSEAFI